MKRTAILCILILLLSGICFAETPCPSISEIIKTGKFCEEIGHKWETEGPSSFVDKDGWISTKYMASDERICSVCGKYQRKRWSTEKR